MAVSMAERDGGDDSPVVSMVTRGCEQKEISETDLKREVKALLRFVETSSDKPIGRYLDDITDIIVGKLMSDTWLLAKFLRDGVGVDEQLETLTVLFNRNELEANVAYMVNIIREAVEEIVPDLVSFPVIIATEDSRRVEYAVRGPVEQEIERQERVWYAELRSILVAKNGGENCIDGIIENFRNAREQGFDEQKLILSDWFYGEEAVLDELMNRMPIRANIGNSFPYTRLSPDYARALDHRFILQPGDKGYDSNESHLNLDPFMPYSSARGLPNLGSFVHKGLVERGIVSADEPFEEWLERFIPGNGSSEAIAMVFDVLVAPHDDVVMVGKANYSLYQAQIQRRGANERVIPYEGGEITENDVLKVLTSRTRLIVINSPNNPGGYIGKNSLIDAVLGAIKRNGSKQITVLFDEAYGGMIFEGNVEGDLPRCMVESNPEQVIAVTDSISKKTGALGPRGGSVYFAGPKQNMPFLQQLGIARGIGLCANTFGQACYEEALKLGPKASVDMSALQSRMDVLADGLGRIPGVKVKPAEGSLYIFPDVSGLKRMTSIATSSELAIRLAKEAHFSIVNGSGFGNTPENDDRIRFVIFLPESTNRELCRRFQEWAEKSTIV